MSVINSVWQSLSLDDLNLIPSTLQFLQYAASIAAVGSILLMVSLRTAKTSQQTERHFWLQAQVGSYVLLLLVPLQMLYLLTSLFDSDWRLIFSLESIQLLTEISTGHSAAVRIVSAALLLVCCWRQWLGLACLPALGVLGSYLVTGHTLSVEHELRFGFPTYTLTILLFLHILLLHWWIAIIWPLRQLAKQRDHFASKISHRFGQQALLTVPLLLIAGTFLLANLVNLQFDLSQAYQTWFLIKLTLVGLILMIAAMNKLNFGRNLGNSAEFRVFSNSLTLELIVAALILAVTSFAIDVGLQ